MKNHSSIPTIANPLSFERLLDARTKPTETRLLEFADIPEGYDYTAYNPSGVFYSGEARYQK